MKKLLAIVAIFCFATIITHADAIQDKSFKEFFKEFQESLKDNKGGPFGITEYFDYSIFKQKCNTGEFDQAVSSYISYLQVFSSAMRSEYKDICKLSEKNYYENVSKSKSYETIWYIEKIEISKDEMVPDHNYGKHGSREVYQLSRSRAPISGEEGESTWCVFAKIKGAWKVVDFGVSG